MLIGVYRLKENNKYGNDFDNVSMYRVRIFNNTLWFTKRYTNEISRKRLINKYGKPDEEKDGYLIYFYEKSDYIMEV